MPARLAPPTPGRQVLYHGLEYLSEKGKALFGSETQESKIWLDTTRWDMLHGEAKAVLDRVRLMQSVEQLDTRKNTLRVLENYLVYHSNRMFYRERLAEGRSIGSGQVEGACKNFKRPESRRLKQTGAKWRNDRVHGNALRRPVRQPVETMPYNSPTKL